MFSSIQAIVTEDIRVKKTSDTDIKATFSLMK